VRTPEELAAVVDKMYAFSAQATAFLGSGGTSPAGQLLQTNADYALAISPWSATTADFDELGVGHAGLRAAILAAFGPTGPSLISYVGHSSFGLWGGNSTRALQNSDVPALLGNAGRPVIVTQWGCWNAYYIGPIESLSTKLLVTPNVGAVAAIGATTLTSEQSHQALGATFFAAIGGGAETLGEAWLAAKRALAQAGGPGDAILGMALLGDPATPLPPPLAGLKTLPDRVWTRQEHQRETAER
jgi:hypothetical protein